MNRRDWPQWTLVGWSTECPAGRWLDCRTVILMSGRSWFRSHDNGALVWTWPLTLFVTGVGLALLGVATSLWAGGARMVLEEPAGLVAVVGFVALLVAMLGRMNSVTILRYGALALPQPPSVAAATTHRAGVRQRLVRRRSGIAYVYMAMFVVGMSLAAWLNWETQPRLISVLELALGAGCGALCYLAGPAARFVVTQRHLYIDTALRRIAVPRHLIGGFTRRGNEVRLKVLDGSYVYVRVDSPIWDLHGDKYRTNYRAQFRTIEKIVAALSDVPAAATVDGGVIRSPRRGMRVLGVVAALLLASALIAVAVVAFA
jgi:hypothetical protein